MDINTDTDTDRSPPIRPSTSFLHLPREIRDSIYHLALHRSISLRPVGKILYYCLPHGHLRQRETCVSPESPPFHPATPLTRSVSKLLNPGLPLQILRVNRQVHEEAAETLYGGNRFRFVIGPTARVRQKRRLYRMDQDRVCGDKSCRIHSHCSYDSVDSHFTYEDNLSDLPSYYLKLIKRCDIHVQMPAVPGRRESQLYTSIQTSLGMFAARFGGPEHSLQDVVIHLNQRQRDAIPHQADAQLQEIWVRQIDSLCGEGVYLIDGCLTRRITFTCAPITRAENVLEPLGTIFGTRTVKVVGVSSEMAAKLSRAMTSSDLACVPKEEVYGARRTRIARRKRKKEMRRYRLGRFYETKFEWAD